MTASLTKRETPAKRAPSRMFNLDPHPGGPVSYDATHSSERSGERYAQARGLGPAKVDARGGGEGKRGGASPAGFHTGRGRRPCRRILTTPTLRP